MLRSAAIRRPSTAVQRLSKMTSQISTNGHTNGADHAGVSLAELPKSNVFTTKLPTDQAFPTPQDSHKAPRERLGPRMVKSALFTYVRPEDKPDPILAGVSHRAMRDIGIREGEENSQEFKDVMAGNKIMWDAEKPDEGVYPWAQCYGGWQFGSWAGQLGDGRAISLFETTNPKTKKRYEIQLKGGGKTPYSRFADGKAVVRSSVREFVVSEALNGLGIPTTRALALTLTPKSMVQRERMEPGAIVCRFAESWLRIGTYDIQRARGERNIIRKLSDYVAEEVYKGWDNLPKEAFPDEEKKSTKLPGEPEMDEEPRTPFSKLQLNRYAGLYRAICIANAKTVAAWQAYGFTNGVLNTDNTSLLGLSLDFGPFAFIDNFDPMFTPNHDDHSLRYCYRNQPSVIWWNLVRLGESMGELLGSGDLVDDKVFIEEGVKEEQEKDLIARAEGVIMATGEEYQREFLAEYKRLMTKRLGLKQQKEEDFQKLYSEALDSLQEYELDFSHFFRRLSNISLGDIATEEQRQQKASVFFHNEGLTAVGVKEEDARARLAKWLEAYRTRAIEDWGEEKEADAERMTAMKAVNPNFVPRGWLLDEIIKKVQDDHDFETLELATKMAENPFKDDWRVNSELEKRWCGEVPKSGRGIMCSCSS